jgi:DNA processing protein
MTEEKRHITSVTVAQLPFLENSFPRAVMYDKTLDSNNPMFDLNRQLISEQRDITILTQKSLEELIKKVKSKKNSKPAIQTNLFE